MSVSPLRLVLLAVACAALAGCGGSSGGAVSTGPTSGESSTSTTIYPAQLGSAPTVWLCRPGLANDPCDASLSDTAVGPDGSTHLVRAARAGKPPVDCFYVYPTISGQPTMNASLAIDFRLQEVAIAQASRFSQVCRVYAPVYRQITLSALDHPARITLADALTAYRSVLAAFRDYLAHYNDGRGIVFIGHSQGAVILIRLLQQEVDRNAALRHRLVSALLLGGNLTVARGGRLGGSFAHIPACDSSRETGCVVAYSSFTSKPAGHSEFGLTTSDAGVGILAPRHPAAGLQIMCVNPGNPAGGTTALEPYLPSLVLAFLGGGGRPVVKTPWVSFPGSFDARCETSGDATWLQISPSARGARRAALLAHLQDPLLGLHILDVNIALGNLVSLVGTEAAAYRGR